MRRNFLRYEYVFKCSLKVSDFPFQGNEEWRFAGYNTPLVNIWNQLRIEYDLGTCATND